MANLTIQEKIDKINYSVKFGMIETADIQTKRMLHYVQNEILGMEHLTEMDMNASLINYMVQCLESGEDGGFNEKGFEMAKEYVELTKKLWFYMCYLLKSKC